MKGRKNKSTLISSSSRSVCPMHIQEARRALRPRPSFCSNLAPLLPPRRNVNSARHPRFSWSLVPQPSLYLPYVRHPLISSLPSLIAPPR